MVKKRSKSLDTSSSNNGHAPWTDAVVKLDHAVCSDLSASTSREWLITNGIGGYASGTVSGINTRCYHGHLVASLAPPLNRTVLVGKLDEAVRLNNSWTRLGADRWADGTVDPCGHQFIDMFWLDGTTPVWRYRIADMLLEKRLFMEQGENTTYAAYRLASASGPVQLSIRALVNYRDHHSTTEAHDWKMNIAPVTNGLCVEAFPGASTFSLFSDRGRWEADHTWHRNYGLSAESERGLHNRDDLLHAGTLEVELSPGDSLTIAMTTEKPDVPLSSDDAMYRRLNHEKKLISSSNATDDPRIKQLVLAADQFVVSRPMPRDPEGKTVIAGYHWFSDWGRDTMIALPGLTLATGRPEVAKSTLFTFDAHISQGMVPNRFMDDGQDPEYNTVDASLWYIEAVRQYVEATNDIDLLQSLMPNLIEIIDHYRTGTRFNIKMDPKDHLISAGEPGVQLTWMDARIGDWVVTPRTGKAIEINALWYNAVEVVSSFVEMLDKPHAKLNHLSKNIRSSMKKYWQSESERCFDVIDGPGVLPSDASLRPNQIFAVSLKHSAFTKKQQKAIVDGVARSLLTPYGLRSLDPDHPDYRGWYGGSPLDRDAVYHQGTVWSWLIGPFVSAHLRVYNDVDKAKSLLEPLVNQINDYGLGSIGEIFDGHPPHKPRGCIAQAWSVAEILRVYLQINHSQAQGST